MPTRSRAARGACNERLARAATELLDRLAGGDADRVQEAVLAQDSDGLAAALNLKLAELQALLEEVARAADLLGSGPAARGPGPPNPGRRDGLLQA
jgi:hypothetical protein